MSVRAVFLILVLGICASPPGTAAATASANGPSETDRAIYQQAFDLAEESDYRAARTTAQHGRQAELNTFFMWLDLTNQQNEEARRDNFWTLDAFLTANPDWPGLYAIERRAEEELPASFSDDEVILWFAGRNPRSVAGALRLAAALRAVGRDKEATDLARRTWRHRTFTEEEEAAFLARHGAELRTSDGIVRFDSLLNRREFTAATRQAKRLGGGYPKLAKARQSLMLNRRGVDAAIAQVPPALQNDPGLLYDRARWRQRRGRHEGVVELLDRAAGVLRRPERWWPIRHWAARVALARGETALAYRLASAHDLKSGVDFAEAEWLAGWLALRFEDAPARAYRHFVLLNDGVSTPISRARSAYWAAEAAAQLGDRGLARDWYGRAATYATAFYGQQAIGRLGRNLDLDLEARLAITAAERSAFEARELVRLVRLLAAFDQRGHVKTFMTHLRRQVVTAAEHQLHAELAQAIGRPDQALFTAKQASRKGIQADGHLFPVPPAIARQLDGTGSPEPALVLALIRQESAFDPDVISRAGARGLMQLMPATAHRTAKKIKLPYQRARLTEDWVYNMQLGRAYLGELLEDYEGSTALALAAYNAGPKSVERWIRDFGDPRRPEIDPVDWIERIPYSETRNYVQRVLEGQVVYRLALNGQKTVLPLSRKGQQLGRLP
ncbi:MAG: lytic transglycosylase domain-containing protein [Kiloniellales bacterium]|nr:lytic transglycosylase domain-containing protein [Kiloniellales bacterium]